MSSYYRNGRKNPAGLFAAGIFGIVLLLNLAWWGFVIFVVVSLLQHFGVI